MTKVFIKQPKADKPDEFDYVETEVADLPLTKDDIRTAQPFQEVLSESIQRREELKKLKKGANAADTGSGEPEGQTGNGKPADAGAETGGNAPVLTVDTIYAEVKSRLVAEQQAVAVEQQALNQRVQDAVTKHKLKPEDVPMLRQSASPDELGAYLARERASFAPTPEEDEKAGYLSATKKAFANLGLEFPE